MARVILRYPGDPVEFWAVGEVSDPDRLLPGPGLEKSVDPADFALLDAHNQAEEDRIQQKQLDENSAQDLIDANVLAARVSAHAKLVALGLSSWEATNITGWDPDDDGDGPGDGDGDGDQ